MAYRSQTLSRELRPYRGWIVALGIGLTILGVFAIGASVATTMLSVMVLGWVLFIAGVIEVVQAFAAPRWGGVALSLFEGILSVVIGVMLARRPLESAAMVTLLLSVFLMAVGLFRILSVSTFLRTGNASWVLASGIISLLLGIAVWAQWPVSAVWVIGAFVGIAMISWGISLIMLGVAIRDADVAAPRHLEAA